MSLNDARVFAKKKNYEKDEFINQFKIKYPNTKLSDEELIDRWLVGSVFISNKKSKKVSVNNGLNKLTKPDVWGCKRSNVPLFGSSSKDSSHIKHQNLLSGGSSKEDMDHMLGLYD